MRSIERTGQRALQFDEGGSDALVRNGAERLQKRRAMPVDHEVFHSARGRCVVPVLAIHVFEEETGRHAKSVGDLMQAASADPVGALLVFLDLLERDAERRGELLLAHANQESPHADAAADLPVHRMR
jgi:hypothetical protein